jgi:hypothetical protein
MSFNSNAWSASGRACDVCGDDGEMLIEIKGDDNCFGESATFCMECLRLVVSCEFDVLQDKQEEF